MNQTDQQFFTYSERNFWIVSGKLLQQFQSPERDYYMASQDCSDGSEPAMA